MPPTMPSFTPTSKRRSFRPSTFRPLNPPTTLEALNDDLRSSLMSVGMRVRKSVPEGYKTTVKPGFSIYEQTAAAHPELQPFASAGSGAATHPSSVVPRLELDSENVMTDEQLEDAVDSVLDGLSHDLKGWQSTASSQESNVSTTSSVRWPLSERNGPPRRKRVLGDGEEELDFTGTLLDSVPMERDRPPRAIAQPRSRRPAPQRSSSGRSLKSVRFVGLVPDDDFGEADFLMPDRDLDL